jgi:hypothetical protein
MSFSNINLRSFDNSKYDVNNFYLTETTQTSKYILYSISNIQEQLPLLKTTDVTVQNIVYNPWMMQLRIDNKNELKMIQQIDNLIVKLVETKSKSILGDDFTCDEIYNENVFISSLSNNVILNVVSLKKENNDIASIPTFNLYEPSRYIINNDRLVMNVVCRCALNPWMIQVFTKTRRVRILWLVDQCMILEEPVNFNCILDAEDDDDQVQPV